MLRTFINTNTKINEEIEEGNIEYKQRLDRKNNKQLIKMSSQMLWRLQEGYNSIGKYQAHYFLGIKDNGEYANLDEKVIDESIEVLNEVCKISHAEIINIDKIFINNICVAEIIINKIMYDNFIKESRVCFLGLSGHGKTTLISHLTHNQLDDGNGLARFLVMKHIHEQITGLTSSINHNIIGMKDGKIINYKTGFINNWNNIVSNSDKIISLIDLPGNNKYSKTTLNGLLTIKPHFNIIVISPFDCQDENKDIELNNYIKLCIFSNIPFILIFSKSDILHSDIYFLNKINDIIINYTNKKLYNFNKFIKNINYDDIPYINISNINNNNFDDFINLIDCYSNKYNNINKNKETNNNIEFLIHDIHIKSDNKNIVYGRMNIGHININEKYYIGPYNNNIFYPITIQTIHKKQIDSKIIYNDETASIEIKSFNKIKLLKNLIIINNLNNLYLNNFMEILLFKFNNNNIIMNSQYLLFYDTNIETVIINCINNDIIKVIINNNNFKIIKKNTLCILKNIYNNQLIFGKII